MARSAQFWSSDLGEFEITKTSPYNCEVFYVPRVSQLFEEEDHSTADSRVKLLEINSQDGFVTIIPTYAPGSDFGRLKPAYNKLKRIKIENYPMPVFSNEVPTKEEILSLLQRMPSGFKKDPQFGLGIQYDYRFIAEAVEELSDCREMVLSHSPTYFDRHNKTFFLAKEDFEEIRKALNRITNRAQNAGRSVKDTAAYNFLGDRIGRPERPVNYGRHSMRRIFTAVARGEVAAIDESEQEELLLAFAHNARAIAQTQPDKLSKLQSDIELVTLERLIDRYGDMIREQAEETAWQMLFKENPFILSLVFGYPIVKVQDEAYVGGRRLSGPGDKIADFLVKNSLTNNTAIIEIKRPQTSLMAKSEYREGIYPPSKELSGSITQTLDQKYQFQTQIAHVKHNSQVYDIESYSVQCCLIIGTTPPETDEKKSFELFRGNSKDVEVTTFDELLEKLRQLRNFLDGAEREQIR